MNILLNGWYPTNLILLVVFRAKCFLARARFFSLLFVLRRPSGKSTTVKDDSVALSFDEDLKAKLAAHNRGVTKGRHTYEPSKGRVKDWKKVRVPERLGMSWGTHFP